MKTSWKSYGSAQNGLKCGCCVTFAMHANQKDNQVTDLKKLKNKTTDQK